MFGQLLVPAAGISRRISHTVDLYQNNVEHEKRLSTSVKEKARLSEYKQHMLKLRQLKHAQRVAKTRLLKKLFVVKSPPLSSIEFNSASSNMSQNINKGSNSPLTQRSGESARPNSFVSVKSILREHQRKNATRDVNAIVIARKKKAVQRGCEENIDQIFMMLNQSNGTHSFNNKRLLNREKRSPSRPKSVTKEESKKAKLPQVRIVPAASE